MPQDARGAYPDISPTSYGLGLGLEHYQGYEIIRHGGECLLLTSPPRTITEALVGRVYPRLRDAGRVVLRTRRRRRGSLQHRRVSARGLE